MSAPLIVHFNGSQRHACRRWSHALVLLLAILTMLMPARTVEAQGFQPPGGGKSLKDLIKKKVPKLIDPSATPKSPESPEAPESPKSPGASDAPKEPAPVGASESGVEADPVAPKEPTATFAREDRIPVVRVYGNSVAVLADGTVEILSDSHSAISIKKAVDRLGKRVTALGWIHGSGGGVIALCTDGSLAWLTEPRRKIQGAEPSYGLLEIPEACRSRRNPVRNIHSTSSNFVAIMSDGSIVCWGMNPSQCKVPDGISRGGRKVVDVSAGRRHIVALLADGSVVCWGENGVGQCDVPDGLGRGERKVTSVSAGYDRTVALLADGSVACWGANDSGQCLVPLGIGGPGKRVTSVAAVSEAVTFATLEDGSGVAWHNGKIAPVYIRDEVAKGQRNVVAMKPPIWICADGSVIGNKDLALDDIGLPKVGCTSMQYLAPGAGVWMLADGSIRQHDESDESTWPIAEGLATPERPAIQVLSHRLGGGNDDYMAILADGSVVSSRPELLASNLRSPEASAVSLASAPDGTRVALCTDGSLMVAEAFPPEYVESLESRLELSGQEFKEMSHGLLLLKDGSVRRLNGQEASWLSLPKGIMTGEIPVSSIVGAGWLALSDGQLVGSTTFGPLPPSPIGTSRNPVVSAAPGIAILADGSICTWSAGKLVFQGRPSDAGDPQATVPKAVSVHRPAHALTEVSLVILEDGSVTWLRHADGACFRPICGIRSGYLVIPRQCKVFGSLLNDF